MTTEAFSKAMVANPSSLLPGFTGGILKKKKKKKNNGRIAKNKLIGSNFMNSRLFHLSAMELMIALSLPFS